MDTRLLSIINALQAKGVLSPAITGRTKMMLRGLQLGIVVDIGKRGLIERNVRRARDRPASKPSEVDCDSWAAARGLYRGQKSQNATCKYRAVSRDITARHLYQKLSKAPRATFRRRPGDFFCDWAMNKVLPAGGPSCA